MVQSNAVCIIVYSSAFGISARHARGASVLVHQRVLSAVRAFAFVAGAVGDVLLQCACHTGFPCVYGFAV